MMWSWKVRVQPSDEGDFEYMAVFSLTGSVREPRASRQVLDARYLYGQGDLAVFLEDLGAAPPEIGSLLDELDGRPTAEIVVEIGDEAMEVLWRDRVEPS
jgi:hypothetical protein